MSTPEFTKSSRARCAIHSRVNAIRICSVPRLRGQNALVKISSWDKAMVRAEYFCKPDHFWFLATFGHVLGMTLWWRPQVPTTQTCCGSTNLAPRYRVRCPLGLLRLINTSRKALCETTNVTWRFLQPSLKRFSRGVRSATQFLHGHL